MTVVAGGQYGSEGKGKLVALLASGQEGRVAVVRCGGTNSGHTVDLAGTPYAFRQLPSAAVVPGTELFLGAGMVVDPDLLTREIIDASVPRSRVRVDRNAVILDDADRRSERERGLGDRVGSTLSGTGVATARKVLRDPNQVTAESSPPLADMVSNVSEELNDLVDAGAAVIVEGTQGLGLSLHHSNHFPYATSRDTSAAAFLSEVGLSPLLVSDVILVFRTFPIRVAGNSGPLNEEVSWEHVAQVSGSQEEISEFTTVSKRLRRVGKFEWDQALEAVRINRPTALTLHGMDYLDANDRNVRRWRDLSSRSRSFISEVESRLGTPVRFAFTGPGQEDVVELHVDAIAVSEEATLNV